MTPTQKIIQEISSLSTNKAKVQAFLDFGSSPRYGMPAELVVTMYDIYTQSSGDDSYAGKYSCGACQDTIYRKLKDFNTYNDNVGQPLLNWGETPQETQEEPAHEIKNEVIDVHPVSVTKPASKMKTRKK
jgi:hypothetical protein